MTRVISDEDFDRLKVEHGDGRVIVVETENVGDVAFRAPSRHEMQRFREQVGPNESGPRRAGALENLVRACVVLPKLPEFEKDLAEYPGLVETCINPLLELAGIEEKPRVRK